MATTAKIPYQKVQPLDYRTPIVDPTSGLPTDQFIRIWQQLFQNGDNTRNDVSSKADKTTKITAGNGLVGGGDLSEDRVIAVGPGIGIAVGADDVHLTDTAVTPGSYGDSTHVGQFIVDQQGRITAATNVAVSGGGGGGGIAIWASGLGPLDNVNSVTANVTSGSFAGTPSASMQWEPVSDWYWVGGNTSGVVVFDFGVSVILTGIGFVQDNATAQGTFQAAGSPDNITYTNLGSPGAWGGNKVSVIPFTNTTPYRYYRVSQTAGSTSSSPYQRQFIFRWAG